MKSTTKFCCFLFHPISDYPIFIFLQMILNCVWYTNWHQYRVTVGTFPFKFKVFSWMYCNNLFFAYEQISLGSFEYWKNLLLVKAKYLVKAVLYFLLNTICIQAFIDIILHQFYFSFHKHPDFFLGNQEFSHFYNSEYDIHLRFSV